MKPMGISINRLAREICVPPGRISAIVNTKRSITADTALRLAAYFEVSPEILDRIAGGLRAAGREADGGAEIARRVHPHVA